MARKKNKRKPKKTNPNPREETRSVNKAPKGGPPKAMLWMIGAGLIGVLALAALSDRETPTDDGLAQKQEEAVDADKAVASKPDSQKASTTKKTDDTKVQSLKKPANQGPALLASLPDDADAFGGDKNKATTFKSLVKRASVPGAARRMEKDVTAFHSKMGAAPGSATSAVLTSYVQLEARKAVQAEQTAQKALDGDPGVHKAALETIVLQAKMAQVPRGKKVDDGLLNEVESHLGTLNDDALKASLTYGYARGLSQSGKSNETIARYEEVARVYPDSAEAPRALYDLGQLLTVKGDTAGAIKTYEQLIREYPKSSQIKRARSSVKMLKIVGKPGQDIKAAEWYNDDPGTLDTALKGKVVMYLFWASWCPHCKREMPKMVELYEKYQSQGLEIIGVTNEDKRQSREKIVSYLDSEKVPFPVALQDGRGGQRTYAVSGIPAAALVDQNGVIRWRNHPARNIEGEIKKLLAEK